MASESRLGDEGVSLLTATDERGVVVGFFVCTESLDKAVAAARRGGRPDEKFSP